MAEIKEVSTAWRPPAGTDWVLVRISKSGVAFPDGVSARSGNSSVFKTSSSPPDVVNTIEDALAWADENSIGLVHVMRESPVDEEDSSDGGMLLKPPTPFHEKSAAR